MNPQQQSGLAVQQWDGNEGRRASVKLQHFTQAMLWDQEKTSVMAIHAL